MHGREEVFYNCPLNKSNLGREKCGVGVGRIPQIQGDAFKVGGMDIGIIQGMEGGIDIGVGIDVFGVTSVM
jgi:hypothetical protein